MSKHGFSIREARRIEEINANINIYTHEKSGARLIHIDTDDNNKVFAIGFRTPPTDDTGVAHIMEHSVLCGSKKYPSKEPFVELLKGSLKTFLNAFTASDYTLYPIASMNDKDFKNLIEVYLDAVFYPNIHQDKQILMQEGWHYEMNPETQELDISGVVYNEMKGAYSSPMRNMYRTLNAELFPETPYRFESGGDPDAIPQLTQEMFTQFHKKHYHPSNSYIYLYGKLDINYYLNLLNDEALQYFDAVETDTSVAVQQKFDEPVRKTIEYSISSNESEQEKNWYAVQYLIDSKNNPEINFAFEVIAHLLLDTPAAPLKNALIKAGIGKDVMGHFESCSKQPTFTILVKDAYSEKCNDFEAIIENTLSDLCKNGIDKTLIEASINIKEFILREADFSGFPKGLFYIWNSVCSWVHDFDPIEPLAFEERLENVKQALNSKYLESLIQYYLLDNQHRCIITMEPKKGLTEYNNELFRKQLQEIKAGFTPEQLQAVIDDTKALKERQSTPDTPESLEKIPLLSLTDVNKKAESYETIVEQFGSVEFLSHPLFTNGIAYVRFYFDAKVIDQDDIKYLGLLSGILTAVSTKKRSYGDLSNLINIHTGGIGFCMNVYNDHDDFDQYYPKMVLDAKVLISKVPKLIEIIREILLETDYEEYSRLLEILNQDKSGMELSLINSGSSYASKRLLAYFSQNGVYGDILEGVEQYFLLKELTKDFNSQKIKLSEKLKNIAGKLFNANNLKISFTAPENDFKEFKTLVSPLIADLNQEKYPQQDYHFNLIKENEAFLTPGKVQYVCKGFNYKTLGHQYTGAMRVMGTIARLDYLWNNIRVLGGAYGAMYNFTYSGLMYTNSYRDPNLKESLNTYDNLSKFIRELNLTDRELTKYILGTISSYDYPETPSVKGETADRNYFSRIDNKFLQINRDQMLSTTVDDIRALADMIDEVMKQNRYCVFGSEGKIKENLDLFQTVIAIFE